MFCISCPACFLGVEGGARSRPQTCLEYCLQLNMKTKALTAPEHYLYLSFLIVLAHVFFMKFIFQETWAYSEISTELINRMSSIAPMLKYLRSWPQYRAYWGVFYSIFWIASPVFLVLGFLSTRVLGEKYLAGYRKQSSGKLYLAGSFVFGFGVFLFAVPNGGDRFWFNEISDNLVVLSITVIQMTGCIFALGLFLGLLRLRFRRII